MKCPNCNNKIIEKDGKDVGGMPGVKYNYCENCGKSRPKTKRQKRGI